MSRATYKDLATQVQCYLLRRGPSQVMRVIQGVRHNANAREVHAVIDDNPELFLRFTYEHWNGRKYCQRACVLLRQSQYEDDYVPEEDQQPIPAPRRPAPARPAPAQPTPPVADSDVPSFL
jgi:hypothetical protein